MNIQVHSWTRSAFTLLVFTLISFSLYAQQKTVTGTILNQETQLPLQGVNISVKGTNTTVVSNAEGEFLVTVPSDRSILVFSYVGLGTQEITVGARTSISVAMSSVQKSLDEVVVIGYGTVKRRDLTGSVASLKASDIVQTPTHNAVEAMQGRVAGVDVTRSSGAPGSGVNIRVRGNRSIVTTGNQADFEARNAPLYIIDGFQVGNASDVNPNDIESIEVLKDASATAIYGYQGANGVVIITTKKGVEGRPKISYDGYYGINGYASFPKPRLGEEYINLRREAYRSNGEWSSPADDPKIFPNAGEYAALQAGQWVDWFDLLNRNGTQQSHNVSLRSGSERTKVFLSLGTFKEEGMLRNQDFKRYNVRLNLDQKLNNWARGGLLTQVTYVDQNDRTDPLSVALSTSPLGLPYDSAGNINVYPVAGNTNTLSPLTDERGEQVAKNNTLRTNVTANAFLELTPLKGLSLRSNFGTDLNFLRRGIFNHATSLAQRNTLMNTASVNSFYGRSFNWDNIATYAKTISDHSFTVTGIVSYLQSDGDDLSGTGFRQLLPSQLYYNLGSSEASSRVLSSGYTGYNSLSFAGRLNYNYKGKYLLSVTERADGVSRLAPGKKWDYFPSVAAAWNVSEENFMSDVNFINNVKLRASYGVAGNSTISVYGTQSVIVAGTNMGFGDVPAPTYQFRQLIGNPDLGWEKSATTNLGLDFSLLSNRINTTIDLYKTNTSNILLERPLPRSSGVGTVYQNIGETENKGIEVGLTSRNIQSKNFKWISTLSFAKTSEKITKLTSGKDIIIDETKSLLLGRPIQSFYSYNKLGIWQSDKADLAARYKFGSTAFRPGDIWVEDVNGDSIINPSDRKYLGSAVPDFVLGLQNNFSYKGFDLGVFFFMRYGQMINAEFLGRYNPSGEGSGPANLDYWTPENPSNDFPRPRKGSQLINYAAYQSLTFVDGSYFKIKTLTLGYTFPKNITRKIHSDNIRLYATGNNLFTKAKSHLVEDYDPERGGAESAPLTRQFVFGLNLDF